MTIALYRPMNLLSTFDDVIDDVFGLPFEGLNWTQGCDFDGGYRPAVESFVQGNEFHLRAEIPGIDPKNVAVSLEDGHLCIKGERKMREMSGESCDCLNELEYGSFSRCFHVPRDIDRENIHARYELGMLDITVPLKESASRKTIPIEGRSISIEGAGEKREEKAETLSKEASS